MATLALDILDALKALRIGFRTLGSRWLPVLVCGSSEFSLVRQVEHQNT